MNSLNAAMLVNLVGFTVGIALYAMLAAMVFSHRDLRAGRRCQHAEARGGRVALILTADEVYWREAAEGREATRNDRVTMKRDRVNIFGPTTDHPYTRLLAGSPSRTGRPIKIPAPHLITRVSS